jgi:hypothetical protein
MTKGSHLYNSHFYGAHFVGNAELDAVVVSDYSSWVRPDDGSKCGVFEPK